MVIKIRKLHIFIIALITLLITFSAEFTPDSIITSYSPSEIKLPIVMYHQISKSDKNLGDYVLSYETLESDLAYLKNNGFTTITTEDLINFFHKGAKLPEKCVMLTFDDGFESVNQYVLPLLKKYDMKAVASVVGSFADAFTEAPDNNVKYAYMNWDTIAKLVKSPYIEIQNHTYDMHKRTADRNGVKIKKDETVDAFRAILSDDLLKFQNKMKDVTGYVPTAFTYPYGTVSDEGEAIIKELGFKAAFTCQEKINIISRDNPEKLYRLNRFNRPEYVSTEAFFERITL